MKSVSEAMAAIAQAEADLQTQSIMRGFAETDDVGAHILIGSYKTLLKEKLSVLSLDQIEAMQHTAVKLLADRLGPENPYMEDGVSLLVQVVPHDSDKLLREWRAIARITSLPQEGAVVLSFPKPTNDSQKK